MVNIVLRNVRKRYDYDELIKVFLHEDEYTIYALEQKVQGTFISEEQLEEQIKDLDNRYDFELKEDTKEAKNILKGEIFDCLSEMTGKVPPWGTLTGVRPVKLCGMLENPYEEFTKGYRVSPHKANQIIDIYKYQQKMLGNPNEDSIGIYIGIPFCPTRCLYCSFTSNQKPESEIQRYLEALLYEIEKVSEMVKESGIHVESIYIGGGTPTTLSAKQLRILITKVSECYDLNEVREFTVEAGRPDTITREKLQAMKELGVDRISINPQTMKDETLELIGRSHSTAQILESFKVAKEVGIPVINADFIAGLPGEDAEDFRRSLLEIIKLGAENITVHTLAVKKSSRLIEKDPDYHYKQADIVSEMMKAGEEILTEHGYRPYYLYRQKHMSGSLENVGYCKDDTLSIYNIRIMDESQSILAMGAGAMSKKYYPAENRLERVANVSNYEIYIERIDEMIERKRIGFFNGGNEC